MLHNIILSLEVQMNNQIPTILKRLNNQNTGYKIKIRYRKNPSDVYRLYLDYWDGTKRYIDNLKLYVTGKKQDTEIDKNTIKLALTIRNKKETELLENNSGISFSSTDKTINFLTFFSDFASNKPDTNYRISYDHFYNFYKKDFLDIKQVDYDISEKYMNYLLSLDFTRYTAQHYFVTYKATLNHAVRLKIIEFNPAKELSIQYEKKSIERLTFQELKKLRETECKYSFIKNGFLFSCYTGLRISDLRNLKFSDIVDGHIKIIQKKTRSQVYIKLNQTAKQILQEQKMNKIDDNVFHIPLGGKTSNRLKDWLQKAGIKKHITFHCARHTFGCMLVENEAPILAVKKLMGHRDIRTTLQYVEKVDKIQDRAIDKLPEL